jgi:hypothetical protein
MIMKVDTEKDLDNLELCIGALLGAQRLDVGCLKSKAYIDFRQKLLRDLKDPSSATTSETIYLGHLTVRVLEPLLVWCDVKEVVI